MDINGKRIAAIDYGERRIGLAVTDVLHVTINPVAYFEDSRSIGFSDVFRKIEELGIDLLVIGFPSGIGDKKQFLQSRIIEFAEIIKENLSIETVFHDESFTSKEAVRLMVEIGIKKSKRREKGNIDKMAAATLLRDFLRTWEGYPNE